MRFTSLRLLWTGSLVALSTVVHALPIIGGGLLKLLVPRAWQARLSRRLVAIADHWVGFNNRLLNAFTETHWALQGGESLSASGRYLVISNHQSWVDIPSLQYVLHGRVPFLKFFLKRELIWVPVLGLAWWALDFPFMQRYSRELLARKPHLAGRDIANTKKACERFRDQPVSVMNFVEGTRFTAAKHAAQGARFEGLLAPKAGGVAFVLETLGEVLEAIVDVTIIYPHGRPTIVQFLSGQVPEVRVHLQRIEIPIELLGGDYENDPQHRERVQQWLNALWSAKDQRIREMSA